MTLACRWLDKRSRLLVLKPKAINRTANVSSKVARRRALQSLVHLPIDQGAQPHFARLSGRSFEPRQSAFSTRLGMKTRR